jgi:hypothetical protein
MSNYTSEKIFQILPVFVICKVSNGLTKEAKKTFGSKWKSYFIITIGWLWWQKSFDVLRS